MVRAVSWHPTGDARRRRGTLTSIAVGAAAGHDEHGTVGPAYDLLGDAAEERPANTRSAVCSHDDAAICTRYNPYHIKTTTNKSYAM